MTKLYIKIVDGITTISSCRALKINGQWVSNPTEEQIYADGWADYVAPEPTVEPHIEPELDVVISDLKAFIRSDISALTDEQALTVKSLFPNWIDYIDQTMEVGFRVWYNDELYKCIQEHTVQSEWTPDITPALYTKITLDEWPEFVQPISAETAYNTGDKVTFEGEHYICVMNNCTWSPTAYPAAWEKQ